MLTTIIFQEKEYKGRNMVLPEFGNVLICTTSLNGVLLDDEYRYASKEAQYVDEQIFFFVEDNEIDLSQKRLAEIILSAVC